MKSRFFHPLYLAIIAVSLPACAAKPAGSGHVNSAQNHSCMSTVCGPAELRREWLHASEQSIAPDRKLLGVERCPSTKCGPSVGTAALTIDRSRGSCMSRICGPPVNSDRHFTPPISNGQPAMN